MVYGLALTGCVTRSLTIRTEPPGALVYVNDQLKGESPVTYDFVWYGWHRVLVRKEGFERLEDRKLLRAPFPLWIPVDFVMELLPLPIRDARTWAYTLRPIETPPAPVPPLTLPVSGEAGRAPQAAPEAAAQPAESSHASQ